MGLPLRDTERHTYAEYRRWTDGIRYELIDGLAYAMVPSPSRAHQTLVVELTRQIANTLENDPCHVYSAPFDVRLPKAADSTDQQIDTVVQPDIVMVCDEQKLDQAGCRGAPDWVIEVASPATASHDRGVKRDLYERNGVTEYWIVHPDDRILEIYRLGKEGYAKPAICEFVDIVAPAAHPRMKINLARLREVLER
ncbi:MAG: Uma2 family endonuclease [Nitrococcus mobilis]|nr:Uma2 family endonuclease [Nitrococcus mobilis]